MHLSRSWVWTLFTFWTQIAPLVQPGVVAQTEQRIEIDSSSPQFVLEGTWVPQVSPKQSQPLNPARIFNSTWLLPVLQEDSLAIPSLSLTFTANVIAIFGVVVDGVSGKSMNMTISIDEGDEITPVYSPTNNAVAGVEYSYQLYMTSGLSQGPHTLNMRLVGERTPFMLDVAVILISSSAITVDTDFPVATQRLGPVPGPPPPSSDSTKLAAAIGGGVGALVVVILFILFTWLWIRRKEKKTMLETPHPYIPASFPKHTYTQPLSSTISISPDQPPLRHLQPIHRPPSPSEISVPSEYRSSSPVGAATAIASSSLGTVPLPEVPLTPLETKHRRSQQPRMPTIMDSREALLLAEDPPAPQGLGLYSPPRNGAATMSRPLPLQPGTTKAIPPLSLPPEKMPLPPPTPPSRAYTYTYEKGRKF